MARQSRGNTGSHLLLTCTNTKAEGCVTEVTDSGTSLPSHEAMQMVCGVHHPVPIQF